MSGGAKRSAAGSPAGGVPETLVAFAHELADAAGAILRRYFRSGVEVHDKPDHSPVTIADRETEQALRRLIEARFPDHGILGEEFGTSRPDAEFVWSLDPIDGTKSFITGRPLFGTLISLTRAGRPLLGVIDQCITRERWLGVEGARSLWNGRPIATRACPRLEDAVLSTTTPRLFARGAERQAFDRLEERVKLPIYGGDCYAYGLVALGFTDLVVEARLSPYDYLALVPVVEGAGGIMTDWQGRLLNVGSNGRVIAAGDARIHAAALEVLASVPD